MNKNRKTSSIEAKLIEDYFVSKKIDFSELQHAEVFHKDDEIMIRYTDSKAKEKVKTMKVTELIGFAYTKQKSFDSTEILKEVQKLVAEKLENIQNMVSAEIEKLKKTTTEEINKQLSGKEAVEKEEKTID